MSKERLKSIDILRALTMLLMIFVNDLWTLKGIPGWLEHKAVDVDGMGLADVVFPAFLFIVGLSIPLAIRARRSAGDSKWKIAGHILERTLALLIMGVFMVNLEYMDADKVIISKHIWQILMTLAFFLIWNIYRGAVWGRIPPIWLKAAGWVLLAFLAIIYRGSTPDGHAWMHFHWWGILGLIGWAYLLSALLFLALGERPLWFTAILALLFLLNVNEFRTPLPFSLKLVVSASNYASVMCGLFVSMVMIRLKEKEKMQMLIPFLAGFAAMLFLFGFLSRPAWGISKILATPSWTAICAGITSLSFAAMHLLADRLGFHRWASFIGPAGYSTLTCYLIPYYVYALGALSGLQLPEALNSGMTGILKSVVFAILIIQLTGVLNKWHIRLKI